MPDREGVEGDPELVALIAAWVEGSDQIDAALEDLRQELTAQLGRGSRGRAVAGLVADVEGLVDAVIDDLVVATSAWLESGGLATVYGAGAAVVSGDADLTGPHLAAIAALAADLDRAIQETAAFVEADTARWAGRVTRKASGKPTGEAAAEVFNRRLGVEFGRMRPGVVRYANGARFPFGAYADMVFRTKAGIAHNAGTVNAARLAGIGFVEILDGANCGLTAHADPLLANGLIVPVEVADSWPLAHPNCRRAIAPRPDLASASSDAGSVVPARAREDQRAFEEALSAQAGARARRRVRSRREPRSRRVTRSSGR